MEEASWSDIRLEELVRILEERQEAGEKKRQRFRDKLDALRERQELLQQRRLDRLKDEGIIIDMDSVRRESRHAMWREKKAEKDGSNNGDEMNGSGDEWEDNESEFDFGRRSAHGGSKSLVHMDSTSSLLRQSRLGRIREEIEGSSVHKKPDMRQAVHHALQRTETKIAVVKSFQIPGSHDQLGHLPDVNRRRIAPKLAHATNLLKAVNAFKSPALSPRTWRGGSAKHRYAGVGGDSRPGSGAASPIKPAPMSKESKARHLFSYSGFNKK